MKKRFLVGVVVGLAVFGFAIGNSFAAVVEYQDGVKGISTSNIGVTGLSTSNIGVMGLSTSQHGVYGRSLGVDKSGVFGYGPSGDGVTGLSDMPNKSGVYGYTSKKDGYGVFARNEYGGVALGVEGLANFIGTVSVGRGQNASNKYAINSNGGIKINGSIEYYNQATNFGTKITSLSDYPNYSAANHLADGITKRWDEGEWAVIGSDFIIDRQTCVIKKRGTGEYPWVKITWPSSSVDIGSVWLFDRPNRFDQVYDGYIVFNGDMNNKIRFGALANDGGGNEIKLRSTEGKQVNELMIIITEASHETLNVGLAEVIVTSK